MQMSQVLQPFARLGQSPVRILSQLVVGRIPSSAAQPPGPALLSTAPLGDFSNELMIQQTKKLAAIE